MRESHYKLYLTQKYMGLFFELLRDPTFLLGTCWKDTCRKMTKRHLLTKRQLGWGRGRMWACPWVMKGGRERKKMKISLIYSVPFLRGKVCLPKWPASQHWQQLIHQSNIQEATGTTEDCETHESGFHCYSQEMSAVFLQLLPLWGMETRVTHGKKRQLDTAAES